MTASFLEQPADWDRGDWLEWRRAGCGGSDVAAIAGLSTFGSPTSVYYDKTGLAPESPESEAMQWGRLLEAPIAAEFTERTGLHVVLPQILVWDVEHPHRRVTLDGLVVESMAEWEAGTTPAAEVLLGTFEAKTTGDYSWDDDHGGIPDRVALQCQWQMGIAEQRHGHLAVLHQGRRLAIYELDFDPAVFDALCRIVDRFWDEHVLAANPPPTDSNPATTAALKGAYGDRADNQVAELAGEALTYAGQWLDAKAALKAAEARVAFIENVLRAALGEAIYGADTDGTELVTWKPQRKARRVDEKRLRAERPEVWDDYASDEGVTRVLRATKALRELGGSEEGE